MNDETTPRKGPPGGRLASVVHLLDRAVKAVPAARFMWPIVGAGAVVSIIGFFNGLSRITFVAVVAVFFATFLFYIFAQLEKTKDIYVKLLGYIILTAITLGFVFLIGATAWLSAWCGPRLFAYIYGVYDVCYPTTQPATAAAESPPPPIIPVAPQMPQRQLESLAIDTSSVKWDLDRQFLIVSGGVTTTINSVLLQGTSHKALTIKKAFAISGLTGHRQDLVVNVQGKGYYPIEEVDIPPDAPVWLELLFKPALNVRDFLDQWGRLHITIAYDNGEIYEHDFNQEYILEKLKRMAPDSFGPHVTPKDATATK